MHIKVTRNKRKSKLPCLVERLNALHGQKAQMGYFKDSGTHTLANMSYASLAFIHEFPENGYHEYRPVIGQVKPMISGGRAQKVFYKNILKSYIQLGSRVTVDELLQGIGRKYMQDARGVFGNSALLVVTNNPTPLVDTGELEANIGYKTSINYTLRKV